mgnify:CR=1 FL=1
MYYKQKEICAEIIIKLPPGIIFSINGGYSDGVTKIISFYYDYETARQRTIEILKFIGMLSKDDTILNKALVVKAAIIHELENNNGTCVSAHNNDISFIVDIFRVLECQVTVL